MPVDWVDLARAWVPSSVRRVVQHHVSFSGVKQRYFARRDPLSRITQSDVNTAGSVVRVGIIHSRVQRHTHYVQACQEMGLPFRVIDLAAPDWLERVKTAGCQLFLVWPDASLSPYARLLKDRCELLERGLGVSLVPGAADSWMYEDKIRTYDWLQLHGIAHPRTWVFFDEAQARAFVRDCPLPMVFKTRFGAAATGVHIVRHRASLTRIVKRAFSRGHVPGGHDKRDREWGSLLLQEYLPAIREWRMVRIGHSYFGHLKGQVGNFHSGSGRAEWAIPGARQLDLLYSITETAGFRSMDIDMFETADGTLLINELQTVFGASTSIDQLRLDGTPGRMRRTPYGDWYFEAGDFARNACANERIRFALEGLRHERVD